jgi:hypothetical protein
MEILAMVTMVTVDLFGAEGGRHGRPVLLFEVTQQHHIARCSMAHVGRPLAVQ